MRLSEIKQPFTILCGDMVHNVVNIVEQYFCAGMGQEQYGISPLDMIVNITHNNYYTQNAEFENDDIYHYSEIDELKHLAPKLLTHSNWYDDVHVMD